MQEKTANICIFAKKSVSLHAEIIYSCIMTNLAVILAGGIGQRAGEGLPKQLRTLADGRTVLQTCIEAFRSCSCIDDILVVMHPDWIEQAKAILHACQMDDIRVIAGGNERWESSWNAIQAAGDRWQVAGDGGQINILLHDCARPFVSERIITDVCKALESHEAVTVAVPATDTIYECTIDNAQCTIKDIPDRSTMFRAQTPQAFRLEIIHKAYQLAIQAPNLQATDDCGIVHRYMANQPIYIVEGDESNKKLTFQEDFTR